MLQRSYSFAAYAGKCIISIKSSSLVCDKLIPKSHRATENLINIALLSRDLLNQVCIRKRLIVISWRANKAIFRVTMGIFSKSRMI